MTSQNQENREPQEYTEKQMVRIGKKMSCCLRHHPEDYGLTLDREGYVPLNRFLKAMNEKHHFQPRLTVERVRSIMEHLDKKRYEINNGRIRALYGHTVSTPVEKPAETPPEVLYHGTARRFLDSIRKEGLLPMERQYVHMSVDIETARRVGKRHDEHPVILRIDTKAASEDGILFYDGNDKTWLCRTLPAKYLSIEEYTQ